MTKPKDTVGIGIIGSGYMATTYAEALTRYTRGARLSAIAGGRRAPSLAGEYGVPAEPSIDALLARADVDGVVVTTPPKFHREQTAQGAAAGKHVLVEKPMAPSTEDCDAMIAACADAGVKLAVIKTQRYRELLKEVKRLIEAGAIGPIRMMTVIDTFPETVAHSALIAKSWILEPENGGLLLDMASHVADFMLWLTKSTPKEVFAQTPPASGGESEPAKPFGVESLMAQIGFASGAVAHFLCSPDLPVPGHPSRRFHFQIVGATGIMDFKGFEHLDMIRNGEWERVVTAPKFDVWVDVKAPERMQPHVGVVQEFIDSIREHRAPMVGGAEGRAAVELVQACKLSAQTGRLVTFPLAHEAAR